MSGGIAEGALGHGERGSAWTDGRVDALVRHFREGLSCAESARKLGVSRAAVIGKRQRLGLARPGAARPEGGGQAGSPDGADPHDDIRADDVRAWGGRLRWSGVPRAPAEEPPPEIFPEPRDLSGSKTLADLEADACRFPLEPTLAEAGAGTRFCARPALAGGPYCARHRAVAYLPPKAGAPSSSAAPSAA